MMTHRLGRENGLDEGRVKRGSPLTENSQKISITANMLRSTQIILLVWVFYLVRVMDKSAWVTYVNAHIGPASNLPWLDEEKLERWERLDLLAPLGGVYCSTDLERTLALLMLERAVVTKLKAGTA